MWHTLGRAYHALVGFNSGWLYLARQLAWLCVALMTLSILLQVFCRYVLNDALPWPEEAARALMLWMTALAAPSAYRYGQFVAIGALADALKPQLKQLLMLLLLCLAGLVLWQLFELALAFFDRGFRSTTSTLRLPWDTSQKLKRAWIYLSMPVCFGGMLLIHVELMLRQVAAVFGQSARFEPPPPLILEKQEKSPC